MRTETGLAFIFGETFAFFRRAWWLAGVAALPALVAYALPRVPVPGNGSANSWIISGLAALAYVALSYWVMRFIALRHNVSSALEVNLDSARTFLPYGAFAFALLWLTAALASSIGGLPARMLQFVPLLVLYLLAPWGMTAPSGSTVVGPMRSLKLLVPHLGWAIGVYVLLLFAVVLLFVGVGLLGGLLLPAPVAISIFAPESLAVAIIRAVADAIGDVSLIAATYALTLRTGVRVSGAADLRAVFE